MTHKGLLCHRETLAIMLSLCIDSRSNSTHYCSNMVKDSQVLEFEALPLLIMY